jgi:hypothetical protein
MREPSRERSDTPAPTGVLFPELLGPSEPAPPPHGRGPRLLRAIARVVLWSLIAVGALRGIMPASQRPAPAPAPTTAASAPVASATGGALDDRRAAAVATAFLREYLTVDGDRAGRAERLARFAADGVELEGSVSLPAGVAQYADLVVAAGSRPVAGGIEVTALAHVLQVRSGTYHDGGTLAFVVPLAVRRQGIAVGGRPRPAPLPAVAGISAPRPAAAPAELSPAAGRVARQAVAALVAGDMATLTRLGGGREPSIRPLPSGWRVLSVGTPEVTGPVEALAAQVPVRVRPPAGQSSYVVPVHLRLEAGPRGLTLRRVDAGGSP